VADFNINISNSLNVFGIAPSNKWGAWNWGAFLWGEGTADLQVSVVKLISESLTVDESYSGQSVTKLIAESFTVDSDMESETLTDGNGYLHVFHDRTTEAENRQFATWTSGTAASGTWTSQAVAATTWSES
jgi:hypothetical protein